MRYFKLTISIQPCGSGIKLNYFFTRGQLGYKLLISRSPTEFLGIKIFSVDVKEISKHSDKNEYLFILKAHLFR